jgi:hypothetical protein
MVSLPNPNSVAKLFDISKGQLMKPSPSSFLSLRPESKKLRHVKNNPASKAKAKAKTKTKDHNLLSNHTVKLKKADRTRPRTLSNLPINYKDMYIYIYSAPMSASSDHSSSFPFPTTLLSSAQWDERLWLQSLAMIMKSTQSTQDVLQGQLLLVARIITFLSLLRVKGCRPLWHPKSKSFFALPIWLEVRSLVLLIFVSCLCFWAVEFFFFFYLLLLFFYFYF